MDKKTKELIDQMSYKEMLLRWRFSPSGDTWFEGKTGEYFSKVMSEKKKKVNHVQISKDIGWGD